MTGLLQKRGGNFQLKGERKRNGCITGRGSPSVKPDQVEEKGRPKTEPLKKKELV